MGRLYAVVGLLKDYTQDDTKQKEKLGILKTSVEYDMIEESNGALLEKVIEETESFAEMNSEARNTRDSLKKILRTPSDRERAVVIAYDRVGRRQSDIARLETKVNDSTGKYIYTAESNIENESVEYQTLELYVEVEGIGGH